VAPFVVLGVLAAGFLVGLIAVNRRMKRAIQARKLDAQYEEGTNRWRSLSPEQRQVARAEALRGDAISDRQAATVALSSGFFDPGRAPYAWAGAVTGGAGSVLALAMGVFATWIGVAHDAIFPLALGGMSFALAAMSVVFMLLRRTTLSRINRSSMATRAMHEPPH
jgi:hypothetical protein